MMIDNAIVNSEKNVFYGFDNIPVERWYLIFLYIIFDKYLL